MLKNGCIPISDCCGSSFKSKVDFEGRSFYGCIFCKNPCNIIDEGEFGKLKNNQQSKKLDEELLTSSKPQSGFSHYRRGGWLQLFRMRPVGWEDRGKCKNWFGKRLCRICLSVLHIGRENNQSFRFCPKCLTKIKE